MVVDIVHSLKTKLEVDSTASESRVAHYIHALSCSLIHLRSYLGNVDTTKASHNIHSSCIRSVLDSDDIDSSGDAARVTVGSAGDGRCKKVHLVMFRSSAKTVTLTDDTNDSQHQV